MAKTISVLFILLFGADFLGDYFERVRPSHRRIEKTPSVVALNFTEIGGDSPRSRLLSRSRGKMHSKRIIRAPLDKPLPFVRNYVEEDNLAFDV